MSDSAIELPEPECHGCHDVESDDPTPVVHVTFKSGIRVRHDDGSMETIHDTGFLCNEHYQRACALDQLASDGKAAIRTVETGLRRLREAFSGGGFDLN